MTLSELRSTMTPEELVGWSAYFSHVKTQQEKAMEEARRRR